MKRLSCVLCALAMLMPSSLALALCSLPQPCLVCAEYYRSELIIDGTLIRVDNNLYDHDPQAITSRDYTMSVEKVFRGKIKGNIRIHEENDSGRASFDWIRGRKYLLFLFYTPKDNAWELDGCGNSAPLIKANKTLVEIRLLATASGDGVIHGTVSTYETKRTPDGVHIEATGEAGHFSADTDDDGAFQIKVPAGQYAVRAALKGRFFRVDSISYDDPDKIQIHPGGCAQIQFEEFDTPR